MPDLFDRLAPKLLRVEGGYSNDPNDPGGATNHGITERVARKAGFTGDMRDLTREEALRIYRRLYWSDPGFADVAAMSEPIAAELFDTGVNQGVGTASVFLQRALNALNRRGQDYPDVKVDGDIGPATTRALAAFLRARGKDGETVMLRALNALQGERYISIVENRPASEDYTFGWFLHRVA